MVNLATPVGGTRPEKRLTREGAYVEPEECWRTHDDTLNFGDTEVCTTREGTLRRKPEEVDPFPYELRNLELSL